MELHLGPSLTAVHQAGFNWICLLNGSTIHLVCQTDQRGSHCFGSGRSLLPHPQHRHHRPSARNSGFHCVHSTTFHRPHATARCGIHEIVQNIRRAGDRKLVGSSSRPCCGCSSNSASYRTSMHKKQEPCK